MAKPTNLSSLSILKLSWLRVDDSGDGDNTSMGEMGETPFVSPAVRQIFDGLLGALWFLPSFGYQTTMRFQFKVIIVQSLGELVAGAVAGFQIQSAIAIY